MYFHFSKKVSTVIFVSFLVAAIAIMGVSFSKTYADDSSSTDPSLSGTSSPADNSSQNTGSVSGTSSASSSDAVVLTGDASATTTADNNVNQNNLDTGGGDATASNTSTTTINNVSTTTADTGNNTASTTASTTGNAIINTGTAYATANVINIANTNILDSSGFLYFLNQAFGIQSFDLRSMFGSLGTDATSSCSLLSCLGGNVTFTNSNDATITNDVIVRSSTGDNSASSTGDAAIQTGDAYAAANILNVANTNIADSNYLMVVFNNFGSLGGDIILPGAEMFNQLFNRQTQSSQGNLLGNLSSNTSNNADVSNNATTTAESGLNTATASSTDASSTSAITTGNAISSTNVVNQVNQNIIGNDSFVVLFRVFGKWNGSILGAPQNVLWQQTDQGVKLYNVPSSDASSSPQTESTGGGDSNLTASSTNNATIKNNVEVYALTGDNKISGGGDSTISTGNAYAGTNIVNVANTNVIGRNWVLLIFNIFGDWAGNLSFGRQDLWIGGTADSPSNPIRNGSDVTYHFTIANKGDSDATNVVLKNNFDPSLLTFDSPDILATTSDTGSGSDASWKLGTIKVGQTIEVTKVAHIARGIPHGEIPITVDSTVTSSGNDANTADNKDEIAITAVNPVQSMSGGGGGGGGGTLAYAGPSTGLKLLKSESLATTTASSTVKYSIKVLNYGGPAYNSVLTDVLKDKDGNVINKKSWNLDTIKATETVNVSYDMIFSASTTPGIYSNSAQVVASSDSSNPSSTQITSNIASTSITIGGEVLGVSTSTECNPNYINGFLRYGMKSNEVMKLQRFLAQTEDSNLPATGFFGPMTRGAVIKFQEHYSSDILAPLSLSSGTGYVYQATKKKINELQCGTNTAFTLGNKKS